MERARIFVFPPIEDFGMVAVEAMATGTPVMANRIGGSGESVQDGLGGALFDPQSPAEIARGGRGVRSVSTRRGSPHTPSSSTRRSSMPRCARGRARTSSFARSS